MWNRSTEILLMRSSLLAEIEQDFGPATRALRGIRVLPAARTLALLDRCEGTGVRASIETFRLFGDGGVQPAMEYSDPTPEMISERGAHGAVRALVVAGAAAGYDWNEVWIEGGPAGNGFRIGDSRSA